MGGVLFFFFVVDEEDIFFKNLLHYIELISILSW